MSSCWSHLERYVQTWMDFNDQDIRYAIVWCWISSEIIIYTDWSGRIYTERSGSIFMRPWSPGVILNCLEESCMMECIARWCRRGQLTLASHDDVCHVYWGGWCSTSVGVKLFDFFTVMQRLGLFSMIRTFICNSMIEDLERSRTIWTYQVWSDNLHIKIRSAWKRSGTHGVILCELAVSVRIERSARCMYLSSFCMSVSWMICFVILQADLCQPHLVSVVSICLFI